VVSVSLSFHPTAGQVALIEPDDFKCAGHDRVIPFTGTVDGGSSGVLTLMELSSRDLADGSEVVVSIFTPEALYRIRAAAHWGARGRLAIRPIHDIQRIERRSWPRHQLRIDVILAALDGPDDELTGVSGHTIDIGVAGMRVETIGRLPAGADVTVVLTLPDGGRLVARTTVVSAVSSVSARGGEGGCEYRLAFDPLDNVDAARLMALVGRRTA
jgi:PilZ domain